MKRISVELSRLEKLASHYENKGSLRAIQNLIAGEKATAAKPYVVMTLVMGFEKQMQQNKKTRERYSVKGKKGAE